MSKSNGGFVLMSLLLISISMFTQKFVVFGSFVGENYGSNRPDPLRNFRAYDGVYDVGNKHYWASAAFTGIRCYAIAGLLLVFGLGFGGYIMIKKNASGNSSPVTTNQPDSFFIIMFSLIVLFTLLAIIACSFQMAANKSCLKRTNKLKETIFQAARNTSKAMRRVINTLVEMQHFLTPYDASTCNLLNVTTHRLRRESLSIQEFVGNIEQPSKEALGFLYFTNLVALILNLVLLVAASAQYLPFLCSFISVLSGKHVTKTEWVRLMACCFGSVLVILHWHTGILVIIFCGWILTTFSWVLTGLDYFFHTFAEDTCTAFDEFEKNPEDNSLQFINPCPNSTDSVKLLVQVGFTVHSFIATLNSKVPEFREVSGIEAGKKRIRLRTICDPFTSAPNYTYSPQSCPKDAIPIGDFRNVLSAFTCHQGSSRTECLGDGRFLPEGSYLVAAAYIQSIQELLNVFPDLLNLTSCSSVKQAFSDIALHQCKPFKHSAKMLWASSLSVSIVMTILICLWLVKAHQGRQRSFSRFSIVPSPPI